MVFRVRCCSKRRRASQTLCFKRFCDNWNGGYTEVDTEAGSEDGEVVVWSFRDSMGSDIGEVHGVEVGEEETVQCKVASPL